MKQKCIFFDRDGIVNLSPGPGYVECWEDFHLMPEFISAAQTAISQGYVVAIATNQRGVARGIMTQETLREMHDKLTVILAENSISLLGIYCCSHERDSCDCRKPKPGLLLQAAAEHNLDLSASWIIGDSETDIEAGIAAGCRTVMVGSKDPETKADYKFADMQELAANLAGIIGT
jgi:histidinol-phosphate phosphatase family protein